MLPAWHLLPIQPVSVERAGGTGGHGSEREASMEGGKWPFLSNSFPLHVPLEGWSREERGIPPPTHTHTLSVPLSTLTNKEAGTRTP